MEGVWQSRVRSARAADSLAIMPVIALMALAMAADRERCFAVGADDYLSKPVCLQELVCAIEAHRIQTMLMYST